jgi:hypothetical protein
VAAANVRVLLLVADASAVLPPLPAGWTAHVNSGDTGPWLSGSQWHFVDPVQPYHSLPGILDVRTPQVVEYQFDFSTLGLPAGHEHVCLAAFITTVDASDRITSTSTDLNTVTMTDKHVAHRNLHLVALGTKPLIKKLPGFMILNFHNPHKEAGAFDLTFDRRHFPGEISLLLPKIAGLAPGAQKLEGFRLQKPEVPLETLRHEISALTGRMEPVALLGKKIEVHQLPRDAWLKRLATQREQRRIQIEKIDLSQVLAAGAGNHAARISGVHIEAGGTVTAVFGLKPPQGAQKNQRYRLDVIQHQGKRILGGSSYVIAMV